MTTEEQDTILEEMVAVLQKLKEGQEAQGEVLSSIILLIGKVKETAEDALKIALEAAKPGPIERRFKERNP